MPVAHRPRCVCDRDDIACSEVEEDEVEVQGDVAEGEERGVARPHSVTEEVVSERVSE